VDIFFALFLQYQHACDRRTGTKMAAFNTFWFPLEYAPGTISVTVAWTGKGFDACKTPRSIYPSTFNRFPVIVSVIPKMAVHILVSLSTPGDSDNRGKCHMDGKRIQCSTFHPHGSLGVD